MFEEYADLAELLAVIRNTNREIGTTLETSFVADTITVDPGAPIFVTGAFIAALEGDDSIRGTNADDNVAGNAGDDFLDGRGGNDLMFGGEGDDFLRGSNGIDTLVGDDGDDSLIGMNDRDVLVGREGNDRLFGGTGNDRIVPGEGDDFINGGEGNDALVLSGELADYRFEFRASGAIVATARDGSGTNVAINVEFLRDDTGIAVPVSNATFTLQLMHASDLEGGLAALDNAPNFATIVDTLEEDPSVDGTLVISAGDNYIPGPFFDAAVEEEELPDETVVRVEGPVAEALQQVYAEILGPMVNVDSILSQGGAVDIAIMNAIGFDASALGNHEFDRGPETVASLVGEASDEDGNLTDVGTLFPYLSANLEVSGDSPLAAVFSETGLDESADQTNTIAPWVIQETGGELFGIIGGTTPALSSISSPGEGVVAQPGGEFDAAAFAAFIQPAIDEIEARGVNKIILTTHLQQLARELELAGVLDGVDIIIAGGSDTRLADSEDRLRDGDVAEGPYPEFTTDAAGDPVAVVSTDGEYSYVGRLVIDFDPAGNIIPGSVDPAVSGAFATDEEGVLDVTGAATLEDAIAASTRGSQVRTLTDAVGEVVGEAARNFIGAQTVPLNGERASVRQEETNLGNLTADANLAIANALSGDPVLVSIKNGGGIRASIPGNIADENIGDGLVSELEITNTLRFNNTLTLLTLSPDDLLRILDHGVAATDFDENGLPTDTEGRFPQVAGVRFSYDPDAPDAEDRVQDIILTLGNDDPSDDVLLFDDRELQTDAFDGGIRIVTLNFLAGGGDDYPFDTLGENPVDLATGVIADGAATFAEVGSEQDALAEYLAANFPAGGPAFDAADTPIGEDTRIVNIAVQDDLSL